MYPIEQPFKFFTDSAGKPLDGGFVYIGQANDNPVTSPITAYWDVDQTQPAAQPLRTSNGYVVRNGTPAFVFVASDYSMLVRDKNGRQVVYAHNSSEFSFGPILSSSAGARMIGFNPSGGLSSTNVQDAITELDTEKASLAQLISNIGSTLIGFLQAGTGAVKRTIQAVLRERISIMDFGAVIDGATDDTDAWEAALAYAPKGSIIEIPHGSNGATKITRKLTISKTVVIRGRGERYSAINWSGGAEPMFEVETGADTSFTKFENIQFDNLTNATHAVYAKGTMQLTLDRVCCQATKAFGTAILETDPSQSVIRTTFRDCYFVSLPGQITPNGVVIHWSGQTIFDNTHFEDFGNCVVVGDYGGAQAYSVQFINGSRTQNSSNAGNNAVGIYAANVSNLTIRDSQLWSCNDQVPDSSTQVSLWLKQVDGGEMSGTQLWGGGVQDTAIYVQSSEVIGFGIHDNTFSRLVQGITIDSGKNPLLNVGPNAIANGSVQRIMAKQARSSATETEPVASLVLNKFYQPGYFTPIAYGNGTTGAGTYTQQIGRFTKIGRLCFFNLSMTWTAHTGTGKLRIGALPYLASDDQPKYPGITVWVANMDFTNQIMAYVVGNSDVIVPAVMEGGFDLVEIDLDTSAQITLSGFYEIQP